MTNSPQKRPAELECDVVRFQNNKDKWIAFIGLLDGRPYEIFTGLADDDEGLLIPKSVSKGKIIKVVQEDGTKRYDFQFVNTRGFKTTMEGLSYKFDKRLELQVRQGVLELCQTYLRRVALWYAD